MGQSAGSMNVQYLIGSTAAAGLFNKAVALSFNTCTTTYPILTDLATAEKDSEKNLGQYTIEQLRSMSAKEILALKYTPTVAIKGTSTGTQALKDAFQTGTWNKVDMIWGGVEGDPYLFDAAIQLGNFMQPALTLTATEYKTAAKKYFGKNDEEFFKLYPVREDNAQPSAHSANDDNLISTYFYASKLKNSSDKNLKTYIYFYNHALPDTPERMEKYGGFHSSDVNYWLNNFTKIYPRNFTDVDYKLGDMMSDYLVNFARNGNPNGKNLPMWKDVNSSKNIAYLKIGDKIEWSEMDSVKSDFWQKIR